jgi:superfamily II DNA or RNA helicase
MIFTEGEMRPLFSASAFVAGQLLHRQGVVDGLQENGDVIAAVVRDAGAAVFRPSILVEREGPGRLRISSNCSCPVGFNCKHVAATLFAKLERAAPVPAPGREPAEVIPPPRPPLAAPRREEEFPPHLDMWLRRLEQAAEADSEDYPASLPNRLLYILGPAKSGEGIHDLKLDLITARALKSGGYSAATHAYRMEAHTSGGEPKHLRPSDKRILRALRNSAYNSWANSAIFAEDAGFELLERILATGRAHWLAASGARLSLGEPRRGVIAWGFAEGDTMRARVEMPEGIIAVNARPPLYIDTAAGLIGAIETGIAPKLAHALLAGPPVPARHVKALGERMTKRAPALAAVTPADPGPPIRIEAAPKAILRLAAADLPVVTAAPRNPHYGQSPAVERVAVARIQFRYGEFEIAREDSRDTISFARDQRVFEIQRDAAREKSFRAQVELTDLEPVARARPLAPKANALDWVHPDGEPGWFDFLYHEAPLLRAAGFEIEIAPDFPFQLISGEGDWSAEIAEGSGIDWLEFGVGMVIDGERLDLIEPIVKLIASKGWNPETSTYASMGDAPVFVPLGGGRFIPIKASRLEPIVRLIHELSGGGEADKGKLRITRADALGLGEVEAALGASVVWRGGEKLREMGRKLAVAGGIPPAVLPPDFAAELRPYQAQGVAWLAFLADVGMGGILADDMGLGKTVQALALVAIEKAAGRLDAPALVIAPTSLMANWRREAEKFAPNLRVLTLHGADRKTRFDAIGDSDLVLTTYPLVARDADTIGGRPWHILLLDEAQTIKNPDATTTKLIRGLDARHRFCLTGTPLENNLGELWSLFAFASPGFLGDRTHFNKLWRHPIEKKGSGERGRLLSRRVRPFILRRTKADVAPELPPKTEIVERIDLEAVQRDVYESIRLAMHEKVRAAIANKGFARSRILILDALLKLRQVCCDPRLLKMTAPIAAKAGSAKLERLMELLEGLIEEGRKIIVFSQFTSMLALIEARLTMMKVRYALLTGQTKDREAAIERFREAATPVFLISLKAGGTGLNLTEADTIVLYDPWWNPAVEEQAIDRAYRIGQDKPVFVHKLVATGTIEEKMEVLKDKKRALAQNLFDADGAPTLAMTEADLDMLFAGE